MPLPASELPPPAGLLPVLRPGRWQRRQRQSGMCTVPPPHLLAHNLSWSGLLPRVHSAAAGTPGLPRRALSAARRPARRVGEARGGGIVTPAGQYRLSRRQLLLQPRACLAFLCQLALEHISWSCADSVATHPQNQQRCTLKTSSVATQPRKQQRCYALVARDKQRLVMWCSLPTSELAAPRRSMAGVGSALRYVTLYRWTLFVNHPSQTPC